MILCIVFKVNQSFSKKAFKREIYPLPPSEYWPLTGGESNKVRAGRPRSHVPIFLPKCLQWALKCVNIFGQTNLLKTMEV